MLVIFFEGYSLMNISQRKPELLKSNPLGQGFFRTVRLSVCCLLFVSLVGSRVRPAPKPRAQPLPGQAESSRQTSIRSILKEGAAFFVQGRYTAAAEKFAAARRRAAENGERRLEARAIGNLGGCEFALHRHEEALRIYREAYHLAKREGDTSYVAVLEANISSLYAQLGELDAAVAWKERALKGLGARDREHLAE